MVSSFHETQSKRKNKRRLPDHLWVLQRALEGRSGRTERSKGAQGRIMHQRPENRGALNKPRCTTWFWPPPSRPPVRTARVRSRGCHGYIPGEYSRSPENPAPQLSQKSAKSASAGRRGRFQTLFQLLDCGIFGRAAVYPCITYIHTHVKYAPSTLILKALLEREERIYLSCPT